MADKTSATDRPRILTVEDAQTDRMHRMLVAAASYLRATDVMHSKDASPGMREGAQGNMDRAIVAFEEAFDEAVTSVAEQLLWKLEDKLRDQIQDLKP